MFEDESSQQPVPQPPTGIPPQQSPDEIPDIFDGSGSTGEHMPDASPETTMHGPSALEAGKLQPLRESPTQTTEGMGLPPDSADLHEPTAIKRIVLASLILIVVALIGGAVWYFVIREVKQVPPLPAVTKPEKQNQVVETSVESETTTADSIVNVDVTEPIKPGLTTSTPIATTPEPVEQQVNLQIDTDKDGLTDAKEAQLATNAASPDSDSDGLTDGAEVSIWGTDPLKKDTDGDTYPDGQEVLNGFNPKGEGKLR